MKHRKILVIGLGRFGTAIVETLWAARADVIAIDELSTSVDAVKDRTSAAFVGDGTNQQVLVSIGAADVDAAIVTFGEDFEASVLCAAGLKALGVKHIVARAATDRQAEVLRAVGATQVLQLEHEMGTRIAADLVTPVAADLVDFAHGYRVVPWVAQGPLVGKSLSEADLRKRYEINVLGYRRKADAAAGAPGRRLRLEVPTPSYVIAEGDTLLLVGEDASVARFVAQVGGG